MTVIAWDGVTLAADKMATTGYIQSRVEKVFRGKWFGEDVLVGCMGDAAPSRAVQAWLTGGDRPDLVGEYGMDKAHTVGMLVKRDGSIYRITSQLTLIEFFEPFYAVGSGAECALGAMHMGATARQAVEAASRFIQGCGLGVDEIVFEPLPRPARSMHVALTEWSDEWAPA